MKPTVLFGILFLIDLVWKFLALLFLLDGCHGAGGNPNRLICDESRVPFLVSLGVPLVVDLSVIGLFVFALASSVVTSQNPKLQTAIRALITSIFVIWILVSGILVWQLPFFSAPL